VSPSTTTLHNLIRKLSKMPGQGSPGDYVDTFGSVLFKMLESAGADASLVVERVLAGQQFRPTPVEVKTAIDLLKLERQSDRQGDIDKASKTCRFCTGRGQVTAFVLSRSSGVKRIRSYAVTCGCPRGQQLRAAELPQGYGSRLSRVELETLCYRKQAMSDDHDGVLRWHIEDDMSGARPEWARWCPALEPPRTRGNLDFPAWMRGRA
jgi:hypothetical protein